MCRIGQRRRLIRRPAQSAIPGPEHGERRNAPPTARTSATRQQKHSFLGCLVTTATTSRTRGVVVGVGSTSTPHATPLGSMFWADGRESNRISRSAGVTRPDQDPAVRDTGTSSPARAPSVISCLQAVPPVRATGAVIDGGSFSG